MMDKHFIIYRTMNLLNKRFYIGKHTTENLDDGYLGSGRRILREIKKHGRKNFVREIVETLPDETSLRKREQEIVNVELLRDPLCLNLKNGGQGGWDHIGSDAIQKRVASFVLTTTGRTYTDEHCEAIRRSKIGSKNFATSPRFAGKTCSDEHKQKIGNKNKELTGERNSQYGTCWITDGVKPIKIQKDQTNEYLSRGYRLGRK